MTVSRDTAGEEPVDAAVTVRDSAAASPEPSAATVERFVDARFSASEATQWEQLVAGGMDKDDATAALLSRRGGGTAGWAFEDALLALQELGHADVAERLRGRWADARPP